MDGGQGRGLSPRSAPSAQRPAGTAPSIQGQLARWLSLAVLAVALVAGAFSFVAARSEANELQDDVLRQVAAMFDQHRLPLPFTPQRAARVTGAQGALTADHASRVWVQLLGGPAAAAGVAPATSHSAADDLLPLPADLADGLHQLHLQGEAFRVLVQTRPDGQRLAVAQPAELRDEIARDSAWRTLMPFLLLLPLLLLVLRALVRRALQPLASLAAELDQRTERDLQPLAADAPLAAELQPIVAAFNQQLARVDGAMQAQQRFVADAAHELRSPMTALSLQAERLEGAAMSADAHQRLGLLRQGIARGRQLLDNLLALARAQAGAPAPQAAAPQAGLRPVCRQVLEDLMPLAEARQLDIGLEGEGDAAWPLAEADLRALVANLVDNAIRYSPDGGRVDLVLAPGPSPGDGLCLQVRDEGPGIAEAERARVFDPFYRVLGSGQSGSGLGLSIVQAIARRTGLRVDLDWTDPAARRGLSVTVSRA